MNTKDDFDLTQFSLKLKEQAKQQSMQKNKKKKGKNPHPPQKQRNTVNDLIQNVEGEGVSILVETFPELNTELHDTVEEGEKIGPKHFVMIRLLGVGAMGKVILVRCVINNKLYAMKMINKKSMNTEKAMDYALYERRVLSKLRHPFLISLLCSFQTNDNLYLITTFCQGGELFKHIIDNGFFDEDTARFYIAEVILAIDNLHSCGIIHRDIKPENILLSSTGHIVVCDFGVCYDRQQETPCPHSPDDPIDDDTMCDNRVCGTYNYMAPEVLCTSTPYGKAVDWWSVGCLLFEMTTGNPPFVAANRKKLFHLIMRNKPKIPTFLSPELRSLLRGLLQRDVLKRLGAEPSTFTSIGGVAKLKQHPWFKSINWYDLERRKIEPPLKLELTDELDTRYFKSCYTEFPLEKLVFLKTDSKNYYFKDFTFVSEELYESQKAETNHN